jgi:hypothetical protein
VAAGGPNGLQFLPQANWPAGFRNLNLVCKTVQLQDASFSVKKAMMLDPQLVYSLPARYLTSVDYSTQAAVAPGADITINLASAPSGMLEGIIISVRPRAGPFAEDNWVIPAVNGTVNIRGGSVSLDRILLEFGGQNIFRSDSMEEYLHWQRNCFGDTLEWNDKTYQAGSVFDIDVGPDDNSLVHPVYFIPLVNDGASVFRGHTNENLPSYGGSQLQLTITPSASQRRQCPPGQMAWDGVESVIQQAGTSYEILVGYMVSSLLEISQGTVDLQL